MLPNPDLPYAAEAQQAVALAGELMRRAMELQTPQERRQQAELDRMIQSPSDKVTMTQLTDQAFRSKTAERAADQLVHILDVQGIPRFFAPVDRLLLKGFQSFGSYLPGVAVPLVREKMHHETANVILPADRELLAAHLQQRREEGVRMNVNYLGEALLGEGEAQSASAAVLAGIADAGTGSDVGQDFHDLFADLTLAHGGHHPRSVGSTGAVVSGSDQGLALNGKTEPAFRSSSTWTWKSTATCI